MSATTGTDPLWWLLQDGSPTGPFPQSEIVSRLHQGLLLPDAPACPVGSTDWRPLHRWDTFSNRKPSSAACAEFSDNRTLNFGTNSPAKSPVQPLPDLANWICVYGLFVRPTLWVFSELSCLATPPIFFEDSPLFVCELLVNLLDMAITLIAVALLFVGALQLRKRKLAGRWFLLSGLGVSLGWLVVALLLTAALFAVAASDPEVLHVNTAEDGSPGFAVAICSLALAATVFEVVAFVWLLTTGNQLPVRA